MGLDSCKMQSNKSMVSCKHMQICCAKNLDNSKYYLSKYSSKMLRACLGPAQDNLMPKVTILNEAFHMF